MVLAPRKKCLLIFLSKKNTINYAVIDAVLGDRRLIALSVLEEFPEESRPSPVTINFTFCRCIHSHSRPVASLLARYISSRAFEEAFLDTAEKGDVGLLQWLLSGLLGLGPSEVAVNRACISLFPDTLSTSHFQRPPPTSRGIVQDTLTVTQWYLYGIPLFDSTNVVNWSKRLKMGLMQKNRNHLGLEEKPERPTPGAAAVVKAEYKHDLAAWLECKDTCVSSIYEAVQKLPEALEVVEQ